jgi:hypothetical protein
VVGVVVVVVGVVVVVVGVVVVVVGVDEDAAGLAATEPPPDVVVVAPVVAGDAPEVDVDVDPVVDVVVVPLVPPDTDAEWATVSEATSAPRPIAPAAAPNPMVAVIRRTRDMARSLASSADRRSRWGSAGLCTMVGPFDARSDRVGFDRSCIGTLHCDAHTPQAPPQRQLQFT